MFILWNKFLGQEHILPLMVCPGFQGSAWSPVYIGMLKPIIISYKLTTCQLLYLTNTYKPREILLTIEYLISALSFLTLWRSGFGSPFKFFYKFCHFSEQSKIKYFKLIFCNKLILIKKLLKNHTSVVDLSQLKNSDSKTSNK